MSATRRLRKLLNLFGPCGGVRKTCGLSGVGPSAGVQNDPRVRQLDVAGVLRFNDLTAQHVDIELCRAFLVGDGGEMRDVKAFFGDGASGRFMELPAIL